MASVPSSISRSPFPIEAGQHFAITGKTGSGKSQFANLLLAPRQFLIFFRTKVDDIVWNSDTVSKSPKQVLSALDDPRIRRIEVFPDPDNAQIQHDTFSAALDRAYKRGGWTECIDEGFEFKKLGLMGTLERHATQGRSKHLTLVTCTQRPVWISRFLLSEPSHHISFWCDGRDRLTLGECISRGHRDAVQAINEKYKFVWTHGLPPKSWTGKVQDLA